MNPISTLLRRIVSFGIRLVLAAMAAVFALSLMVAGLVMVLFAMVRALITGRRPVLWQTWRTVRARQRDWPRPATPGPATRWPRGRQPVADDVTDVEGRDIPRS